MDNQTYFQSNQWGVILGGSSGMGLATAQKLASEGLNLCLVHRDRKQNMPKAEAEFEAMRAKGVQVITFNVDALREDKRQAVVDALKEAMGKAGRVKMLLHSIAKGNLKPIIEQKSEETLNTTAFDVDAATGEVYETLYQNIQDTYRNTAFLLENQDFSLTLQSMALSWYDWVKHLLKEALFDTDARILGMTSEGSTKAWRGYAAVSAAKATMESLARSMALEFAPYGLRCNTVQAGVTDTPSLRMIPGSEHLKMNAVLRNPFHRLTRPEDVAAVIYLLCRKESAWINGANIPVDGGERVC